MRMIAGFIAILCLTANVHAKELKTYTSSTYNFSIAYPEDWKVIQQANVIVISSPPENPWDNFSENVNIMVDNSKAVFYSLDKYVESALQDMKKDPYFRLEGKGETTIGGKSAIFLIHTGVGQGKGKVKQYILSGSSAKYIITYTAPKNNYDKFLKQAEQIMSSMKIIE